MTNDEKYDLQKYDWWESSQEPADMMLQLAYGRDLAPHGPAYRVSDRKCRLILCAYCRTVWNLLEDLRCRYAVEVAEKFADGVATRAELAAANNDAEQVEIHLADTLLRHWDRHSTSDQLGQRYAAQLAAWVADPSADRLTAFLTRSYNNEGESVNILRLAPRADIVRDIAGNPYLRAELPPGPECRACKGRGTVPAGAGGAVVGRPERVACKKCQGTGRQPCPHLTPTVLSLAQAAYTSRNKNGTLQNDRLMVLSDALEDAGLPPWVTCPECCGAGGCDADSGGFAAWGDPISVWQPCSRCASERRLHHPVLVHLRSAGIHHPGCWALDLARGLPRCQ